MGKIYFVFLIAICLAISNTGNAQNYRAPQDTSTNKRSSNESLSSYSSTTQSISSDSRLLGCAVKAASVLKDTTKYNNQKGMPLSQIFSEGDLKYVADQGVSGVIALFNLINQNLPMGEMIAFKTDDYETILTSTNPLVLKNLRAMISDKPASITQSQWKDNVYQSYKDRDYGTKLFNTITITAATTEIRETPDLEIIDYNKSPITLKTLLLRDKTEAAAVLDFREHTVPNSQASDTTIAQENYKRALFELIRLQENDINTNDNAKRTVADMANDLQKGKSSNIVNALKYSQFFKVNVPGSIGPVLLTESNLINSNELAENAHSKAMELMMLTSLHYGIRDAVKLFRNLLDGNGAEPARESGFSAERVDELTGHGTEKFKSLGFQKDKTQNMTDADLVLVAVSSPDVPQKIQPNAYLGIKAVGQTIINNYSTVDETTITQNSILFNPRISLSSRHTEYRTAYDPIDYVPEIQNGQFFDQRGSKITQNGVELRLESDIYFSNLKKIADKGVKPVIFPEFGVIAGIGNRSVGYDQSTTQGPLGAVPQFQSRYTTWGAHLGLNVGPVMLGADATIMSTPVAATPDERFFDLSQGMTYYRYELLTHVWYVGLKNNYALTFDLDLVGETNNEGFGNLTSEQGTDAQIKSAQWYRDYNAVHAGGVYNQALATSLLNNGYVKASYPSANYAAIKVGLAKSNFKLIGTAGLYNIHTRTGEQIYDNLVRNTLKGDLFGSLGLTYSFGSKSYTSKITKSDSYSSTDPNHKVQQSATDQQSGSTGPRDHYIIISK